MSSAIVPRAFSATETCDLLPLELLIPAVGRAFLEPYLAPERVVLAGDGQDWIVMPGLARGGSMLCKVLRVAGDGNVPAHSPRIHGVALLLDRDARFIALLDGGALTARRTAAVAAYATSVLATPDASVLGLFGVGTLAEAHVEAVSVVRSLSEIRVVGRSPQRVQSFCERMRARGYPTHASNRRDALKGAQIVVTATSSPKPVFADVDMESGVHINAMGSYRPDLAEVPAETVARARVVVETRETAWAEAGDLIQPLRAGLIGEQHVWAELRDQTRLAQIRRLEPEAVTLFKSVGHVALDLAAVGVALEQLADHGA